MTGRLVATLQLNDNRWIREVIGFLRKKEKTMDKWRDFGEFSSDFLPVGSNTGSNIVSQQLRGR